MIFLYLIVWLLIRFFHLAVVGKIHHLEQEGGLDMFTGTGFPD